MLEKRLNRRALAASGTAAAVSLKLGSSLRAQDATPIASDAATGTVAEVLLTGLADPRFIVIDGSDIYFTESGTGGDEDIFLNTSEGTPEPTEPISKAGKTGKVSKLAADGTVTAIASDLMSYTFGANGEIVGPAGLALDGSGAVYVAVGAPGPFVADLPRTGEEGVLVKIDIASGKRSVVADLIEWEITNNPDPVTIDSNPYGIDLLDGIVYIADAGGNSILAVDTASGELSTFAVPGGLAAEFLPESGNPGRGGARELDSVPSGVVTGPDGRIYVCYITGGPFPAGLAPVDAFSPDGTVERVVEGLTMTADIAFDSAGTMYASIASTDMINGGPGQIVRIEADGSQTVVVDGLALPAGIAFDENDNLYVLNKSSVIPGGGELIRYSGVTASPDGSGTATTPSTAATPAPAEDGAGGSTTFAIKMIDTAFEPSTLTIPANVDVTLAFENTGFLAHDFVLADPKMVSKVLGNGQTDEMTLNLPAGSYTFYCSQIGHRAAGMEGTLTVE